MAGMWRPERILWRVANHMGIGDASTYVPFDLQEHYHDYCEITDWNNDWQVENCWLFNLPDLAQEHPYVDEQLCNWIDTFLTKFDIDGIRIDTVTHVPKWFWEHFVGAADIYEVGEVYSSDLDKIEYYIPPLDATLNYPYYYSMKDAFVWNKSMRNITNLYKDMGIPIVYYGTEQGYDGCADPHRSLPLPILVNIYNTDDSVTVESP
uniref:Alpha-amylase 1-like n=1 Tax=Saccoglossus kowalevskii TaxID=10224 RepID=A0ABM0MIH1_SACKO|nr:PREDICTED: alpha-amylase 1-like [Saccoglossus kowalevskii]